MQELITKREQLISQRRFKEAIKVQEQIELLTKTTN